MCQWRSALRGRRSFDACNFLSDQPLGDVGDDLLDEIASDTWRQALDDATSDFVDELLGHGHWTARRGVPPRRGSWFALLHRQQRIEGVEDDVAFADRGCGNG